MARHVEGMTRRVQENVKLLDDMGQGRLEGNQKQCESIVCLEVTCKEMDRQGFWNVLNAWQEER